MQYSNEKTFEDISSKVPTPRNFSHYPNLPPMIFDFFNPHFIRLE